MKEKIQIKKEQGGACFGGLTQLVQWQRTQQLPGLSAENSSHARRVARAHGTMFVGTLGTLSAPRRWLLPPGRETPSIRSEMIL